MVIFGNERFRVLSVDALVFSGQSSRFADEKGVNDGK